MKLSSFIALRYLRSPKSHSVINLISWVAGIAIAIPTAALVIILSFHNGLTDKINSLFNAFDPEILITSTEGKFFDPDEIDLTGIEEIESYSYTIEENVLIRLGQREHMALMRGVDSNYNLVTGIEELIVNGEYQPQKGDLRQAIVGQEIAYQLGVSTSLFQKLDIYSMRSDNVRSILPTPIYRTLSISPVGIFSLNEETSGKYIFVPISFAQELLGYSNQVSTIDIRLKDGVKDGVAKKLIQQHIGDKFEAKTRFEQQPSIYKAINMEKWVIYLLLMLVLVIASLSLAGSIIILITDKRKHIETLRSMGATTRLIRDIFRREGMLIVAISTIMGTIVGLLFSLLQQKYGFLKMVGSNMITDHYPVKILPTDIVLIVVGVSLMGWIISAITTYTTIRQSDQSA